MSDIKGKGQREQKLRVKRRKNDDEKRAEAKNNDNKNHSSNESSPSGKSVVVQEHGTEVLLIRSDLSPERFPESIKEARYSTSFIEHQKRLEQSQSNVTVDHLLKSSLDLDDTAKKKIEEVRAIGSKRFAGDLIELLEAASKAIEQNANLISILRHHLGLGSHAGSTSESQKDDATSEKKESKS